MRDSLWKYNDDLMTDSLWMHNVIEPPILLKYPFHQDDDDEKAFSGLIHHNDGASLIQNLLYPICCVFLCLKPVGAGLMMPSMASGEDHEAEDKY